MFILPPVIEIEIRAHKYVMLGNSAQVAETQRNIFEILLTQPEIRLYLPFSE